MAEAWLGGGLLLEGGPGVRQRQIRPRQMAPHHERAPRRTSRRTPTLWGGLDVDHPFLGGKGLPREPGKANRAVHRTALGNVGGPDPRSRPKNDERVLRELAVAVVTRGNGLGFSCHGRGIHHLGRT